MATWIQPVLQNNTSIFKISWKSWWYKFCLWCHGHQVCQGFIHVGLHAKVGCQTLHLNTIHQGDQLWSTANKTCDSILMAYYFPIYYFLSTGTSSLISPIPTGSLSTKETRVSTYFLKWSNLQLYYLLYFP